MADDNVMLFAQRGYEAYSTAAGGHSLVSGDPLPGWEDLLPAIQKAWTAAAAEILDMAGIVHIAEVMS